MTARATSRADTEPWYRSSDAFGPYLVQELLASGGLSLVHRAVDPRPGGREIALKRLHEELADEWQLVQIFMQEAQLASQLGHPNVARTLAYGRIDGTYYAANELVRGPTLAEVVRQSRTAAGALPVGVVVELLVQLCDALDHLHTASPRVIHAGLAPSAVMVSREGRVKLIDLGIAQTATRRRLRPAPADARDDVLALGAVAHELLSGRPLAPPVQPPSRWAPAVPRELDEIVLLALAPDPAERWQRAATMRVALAAVARALGGRLRLAQQTREWLAWAFTRRPRRPSTQLLRVIDAIEQGA